MLSPALRARLGEAVLVCLVCSLAASPSARCGAVRWRLFGETRTSSSRRREKKKKKKKKEKKKQRMDAARRRGRGSAPPHAAHTHRSCSATCWTKQCLQAGVTEWSATSAPIQKGILFFNQLQLLYSKNTYIQKISCLKHWSIWITLKGPLLFSVSNFYFRWPLEILFPHTIHCCSTTIRFSACLFKAAAGSDWSALTGLRRKHPPSPQEGPGFKAYVFVVAKVFNHSATWSTAAQKNTFSHKLTSWKMCM